MPRGKSSQALKFPRPKLQPVEVEWIDAAQHDFDGPPGDSPPMVTLLTVGYFCKKTRTEVHVATDRYPEGSTVRSTNVIPRVHIRRFTLLAPIVDMSEAQFSPLGVVGTTK